MAEKRCSDMARWGVCLGGDMYSQTALLFFKLFYISTFKKSYTSMSEAAKTLQGLDD